MSATTVKTLCVQCQQRPRAPRYRRCETCRHRRGRTPCVTCGTPKVPNAKRCQRCHQQRLSEQQEARASRIRAAGEKRCTQCELVKPLNEFHRDRRSDGRTVTCRMCNTERASAWQTENRSAYRARIRNWKLQQKYGITADEYDRMLDDQGGVCAICRQSPQGEFPLHVDHDHDSGDIRGLLCFSCNSALGSFKDDPELLIRAARYLGDAR